VYLNEIKFGELRFKTKAL